MHGLIRCINYSDSVVVQNCRGALGHPAVVGWWGRVVGCLDYVPPIRMFSQRCTAF